MKLELLAECVTRLAECDIDNPADQKTISVCENYVLESYNYYLESCEMNGYEPLSKSEYLQEMMLNEGFFKKLLGIGAVAGGAVAAGVGIKKGVNAINQSAKANNVQGNFMQRAKAFKQNSGGIGNAMTNAWRTSANNKKAGKQWSNANTQTTYTKGDNGVVTGQTTTTGIGGNYKQMKKNDYQANNTVGLKTSNGQTQQVDVNSKQGQQITNYANARTNENSEAVQKEQASKKAGQQKAESVLNGRLNSLQAQYDREEDPTKKGEIQKQINELKTKLNKNEKANGHSVTESINPFIASELKQPLTPAIKMPSKYQ